MHERSLDGPPGCVTAEYSITLRRPTPPTSPSICGRGSSRLTAIASRSTRTSCPAEITATARGVFVAVGPDHPAYERW